MLEFKEYEAEYKKCLNKAKGYDPKTVPKRADNAKFWRYDAIQAMKALPEVIGKLKGENIDFKTIPEFKKESKDVKQILKYVDKCHDKQFAAIKGLVSMQKDATTAEKSLKGLYDNIANELKKEKKPDKKILKLQKQIESDLKGIINFRDIVSSNGDPIADRKKYFDKALAAKKLPNKFTKVAETKLSPKKLKGNHNAGLKALKEFEQSVEGLAKLIEKPNLENKEKKEMALLVSTLKVKREDILEISDEYNDIKKQFQKDIDKSTDRSKIEKAMKKFAAIRKEATEQYDEVKRALKDAGHKAKA